MLVTVLMDVDGHKDILAWHTSQNTWLSVKYMGDK